MKIILVYNAESNFKSAMFDMAHKILSPQTYACDLCKLTHGAFKEKANWTRFVEKSFLEFEFLHKDEYELKYEPISAYPFIASLSEGLLTLLVDSDKLKKFQSELDLIDYFEKLEIDNARA